MWDPLTFHLDLMTHVADIWVPRGERSVAPSGAILGPPPRPTSAPCSVLPPAPATAARAERRSAEQPHLETPRPVLNSPAQEESEDSDHEQAFAGSKPRRRQPTASAAQTDRATAHSPGPSAHASENPEPAEVPSARAYLTVACPRGCSCTVPTTKRAPPASGGVTHGATRAIHNTDACSFKTAERNPTP